MAGNIKGITVEIGGNTGPLNDALKDVNKTARDLQGDLREVNKNLKFNPSDTVMLSQKHKLLAESITNTKTKLETLKEAERQAEEQFKQGKISEQQYQSLQREISKTENQLKLLEKQYKSMGNAASEHFAIAGEKIKNVGGKFNDVGKKASVASAAFVGIGATAIKSCDEVDKGFDNVIRATGATGDAAKQLEESYKNVAQNSKASFDTIGLTMGEINTRFDFTGKQLEDTTTQFLKFSSVTGTDAKTAVQLVSRAMGDAGIKSSEYSKILDMLTVAGQKSGISIDKLTENLAKYGAPMRALGLSTQESIAIFSGWEKAGVNTEIAFSGMKKAISNWSKEGKDSRVEFSKTLDEIKKCPDISSATTKAIQVFGAKAGPDLADAIRGGRFEVGEYTKALKNSANAVNTTFKGTQHSTDNFKKALNSTKVASAELGKSILVTLAPVIKAIADKARQLAEWMRQVNPSVMKVIVTIGLIVAAIGPLLIIIGKVITAIGSISTGISVLMAHPVILVIAAIVAAVIGLVAAIKHLWDTNESFRNFITNMWNGLKSAFSAVCNFFKSLWSGVCSFFSSLINGFKSTFTTVINAIKGIWTGLCTIVKSLWNVVITFIIGYLNIWKSVFIAVVNVIKAIWNGLCSVIKSLWSGTVSVIKSLWNGISAPFRAVAGGIKSIWSSTTNWMKSHFNNICSGIKSAVNLLTSPFRSAVNGIKSIWNSLHISFPKIKLPHFRLTGEFSLKNLTVPHLSIDWYSSGGIFKTPSVLQSIGIGDAYKGYGTKAEAVVPLDEMYEKIEKLIGKQKNNGVNLNIEHFENNRQEDVEQLCKEIEFYRRRTV